MPSNRKSSVDETKASKKAIKKVVVESSDSDSSSSEEVKAPIAKRQRAASNASNASGASGKKAAKKVVKKDSSDSDSSDSDKPAAKKAAPAKKAAVPAKKAVVSDSDSSDSDKPAAKKAAPAKKAAAKKDSSSDSDDSDVEVVKGKKVAAPAKKAAKKDSSDSDSSDSDKPAAKKAAKSSDSESEQEDGPADEEEEKPAASFEPEGDEDPNNKELFVKSLSFDTSEEGLRAHFEQYGALLKVKLISSMGRSKGIGFVEFENFADAKKALAESNGFWLDNRQISCEFSGAKPQLGGPTSGAPGESDTIFCGNLGFHTDENAIYEFFGQAGAVKNVRIAMGEDGRAKGFCHVEFESPEGASAAMGLAGQMLDGRVPRLDLSSNNKRGGGDRGGRGGFGGGRGFGDRGGRGSFGGGRGGGFGDRGGRGGGFGGGRGGGFRGGDRGGRGGGFRGGDRGGRGGFGAAISANKGSIQAFAGTKTSF